VRATPSRRFAIVLAGIVLAGAFLRLGWIVAQVPTTDDSFVAWTATNYVTRGEPGPTMSMHPVLRNFLVYASMKAFGGSVFGVKGFSLLFGILLVGVTGLLVRRAVRDERAGLIAAALVALDIVQIDYSRQAIQEIPTAFFVVTGIWLVVEALRSEDTRCWSWLLPIAGVTFGFGVASKYYAVPPLALSIGLLLYASWRRRRAAEAVVAGVALGPLAFLTYLLTYIPWFGRGYDLGEWVRFQSAAVQAIASHTKPAVSYLAFNRPSLWFLQPFYGYVDVGFAATGLQVTIAAGNPFVWLAVLPAAAYSVMNRAQRRRDTLLLAFFAATYLPFALSPRPVWLLSSVVVFPLAAGIMGSVLSALARRFDKRLVLAYGCVAVVTSLLMYPLAIGRALDFAYLRPVVARMGDYMSVKSSGR
jgi:4-amino-4-deoxy-L-arabinose transferase-like glycosyltransferase